jgi:hypothetical protein
MHHCWHVDTMHFKAKEGDTGRTCDFDLPIKRTRYLFLRRLNKIRGKLYRFGPSQRLAIPIRCRHNPAQDRHHAARSNGSEASVRRWEMVCHVGLKSPLDR